MVSGRAPLPALGGSRSSGGATASRFGTTTRFVAAGDHPAYRPASRMTRPAIHGKARRPASGRAPDYVQPRLRRDPPRAC